MSSYIESKPLSLVERKKQQWARERGIESFIPLKNIWLEHYISDEMASLTAPWGTNSEKNSAASRIR